MSGGASAIGLGELRGHPALGERLRLEIDLLGADKLSLDPACFRLVQPTGGGDLPWLTKAGMSIRKATPPVLEIRSEIPLREPILQLAVQMGCGIDVSREYMLLASPVKNGSSQPAQQSMRVEEAPLSVARPVRRMPLAKPESTSEAPPTLKPQRVEKRLATVGLPDRLMLSAKVDVGEPSLRLATELFPGNAGRAEVQEAQREILRLEFRMLAALHEQVTTQMATAEKLRNMEGTLSELQQRTSEFAQRVEKSSASSDLPPAKVDLAAAQSSAPVASSRLAESSVTADEKSSRLSEWSLYGAVLGGLLGLGSWLGWRRFRERQPVLAEYEYPAELPEIEVDPERDDEREGGGGVDLHVEPSVVGSPMRVDVELDGGGQSLAPHFEAPPIASSMASDPVSIGATTVDEHFEANPVMELADIMLSFGRVKGAAQALQEYIDHSPQDALQPWIRLMDVYRMAGMRTEFEAVAANLNKNFNVEIQQWDAAQSVPGNQSVDLLLDDVVPQPVVPRPESLEDMPRIMSMVCELWSTGDVVGYLYQLLRDNRGGKRLGFALPVVEEILFLVELRETSNRIQ